MRVFLRHSVFLFILFFFILPAPTFAYLDPGTGSYLLQIMAAAFFGGTYIVATWWRQIRSFITGLFFRKDKKTTEKSATKEK